MVSIVAEPDLYHRIAQAIPEVPTLERPPPFGPGTVPGQAEALFLQLRAVREGPPRAVIEALLDVAPWLSVVPVVTGDEEPGHIVALGALGMTRVLSWPTNEAVESWRRSVPDLLCSALGDMVFRRLALADPVIRRGLTWAVATAHRGPTIDDLAHRVGHTARGLRRHLADAGGVTPGEMLTLGRVIQGMHRLRISTLSVERVALIVGFASASGLRRALWRHVGVRPSDLRAGTRMRRSVESLLHRLARGPRLLH